MKLNEIIAKKVFTRVISRVDDVKKQEIEELLNDAKRSGIIEHLDVIKLANHLQIKFSVVREIVLNWCFVNEVDPEIADPMDGKRNDIGDPYESACIFFDDDYVNGIKTNMAHLARNIGVSRNTTYAYLKRWKKDRGL